MLTESKVEAPPEAPLISVVICTHNRAPFLGRAVASVLEQDFPSNEFEVLVVDNCSSDDTEEICGAFTRVGNVRYLYEPELGLCRARNTGWRAAHGRIVAFCDDDAIALPGWLASIKAAFTETSPAPGMVGGRVEPIWEAKRPIWLSDSLALGLTILDWCPKPKFIDDVKQEWLVGANIALPRHVLAELGGFEPVLDRAGKKMMTGGDVFLQRRVIESGYPCVYFPSMAIRHLVPRDRLTKTWFIRRYYWQGISDATMALITTALPMPRRIRTALCRIARLFRRPRHLLELLPPRDDDPIAFERHCFALIEIGYIMGMLGAAKR